MSPRALPVDESLVLGFGEIGEGQRALVGGKAYSLAALHAAGFRVPEGFALTTRALERVIEQPAVAAALAAVATGGDLGPVREQLLGAGLPAEVRGAVAAAFGQRFTDRDPLAVRSSGTKEDLEGASFAGQYETVLNVRGETALELAIKRCWASLYTARVAQYAAKQAGGASGLGMSVVIQRMVPAEVAGVLFTVNPMTGREREMIIEAAFGLGEALVSGRVNADRFVVDAVTGAVLERAVTEKALKIVPNADGTTREVSLAGEEARRPTLSDAQLAELAELGAAIAEHYGRPMDIEWAYAGETLHVLQARPITRLNFAADIGEWTTADFREGGVSSDVCSPFMWSLYELAFDHSMDKYFKAIHLVGASDRTKWTQMFFARPYWNLGGVKQALMSVPGFNERNFDTDLGIEPGYEGPGRTTAVTVGGVARALPVLFSLRRSYAEVLAHDRRYVAAFARRKEPYDLDEAALAALDRETFAKRYRSLITDFYFETETSYFTTIYNTSNCKLDFKVHFNRAKEAAGGTLDLLSLMSGLKDLSHLRPSKDLHDLCARLSREGRPLDDVAVREFATRWKQHGKKELDIRVPRWKDDLPFVRQMMEQALAAFDEKQDPTAQTERQHAAYLAERGRALAALRLRPWAGRAFKKWLELVRSYAWWREEMRDYSSYVYYLVRMWSVEAARRLCAAAHLGAPDDIWYLTYRDAIALVDGTLSAVEADRRVATGRRMVRSFRNFQNPNEIGNQYRVEPPAARPAGAGALRGTGCSPGRVEGTARVIKKLDEMERVGQGDILVTIFTDPGWTPLFARLSGVVTETGGVLTHAAVISREYGIPAVLAVPGATQRIGDGDRIAVDGTGGTVEILTRASG
jgi:pyruvate,water dikinase